MLMLLAVGCGGKTVPAAMIYIHPQEHPITISPDMPPNTPFGQPADIPRSKDDDPSLVTFKNLSHLVVRVEIDGKKIASLKPYAATADVPLRKGAHYIRLITEIPTRHFGTWEEEESFTIMISPRDSARIIYLP
ncbi:MAG: hypothetical protein US36_C0001G0015 [Candidatus Wolfebacteria bacterium GW2011_GWC1_37_10]|nr:MAG: hypothetical protein US36_C0001G0015 [Candidatus Wolfebacteria bacterium GW2011_GWC1_37_10]